MIKVHTLVFNPFSENTYVLEADNKRCAIVDPGCYSSAEKTELAAFIEENRLEPEWLINTHFHLDHVFGNRFVAEKWHLKVAGHREGNYTLAHNNQAASLYGFPDFEDSPPIEVFLHDGQEIELGGEKIEVRFVPGHSRGHIALISHADRWVVAGDVLFNGSIGRTDLPGGDFETLERSIREKLYTLPEDYTVHCGHGPATTIGNEKYANPFVRENS